ENVRSAMLAGHGYQDLPFELLVDALAVERSLAHSPLFQVMLAFQNAPTGELQVPGLTFSPVDHAGTTAKFDLSLSLSETADGMTGALEYATDLFDRSTIERFLTHFANLLAGAAAEPERPVSALRLMDAAEEELLRAGLNRSERTWAQPAAVHDLFTRQAERTPDKDAALGAAGAMTYRELARRSGALARRLQQEIQAALNLPLERRVGLLADPGPQVLTGMLGILMAGAGFVPLDPRSPDERLAWMLADSACEVLVTQRRHLDRVTELASGIPGLHQIFCLDDLVELNLDGEAGALEQHSEPRSLAYIVYTSGSTGRPKGVQIEHRSTVTLLHWLKEQVSDEERRAVLGSTSVSFDVSVAEIFGTLCWGGRLVLVRNALSLAELPPGEAPVLASMAPSAAAELLRTGSLPPSVRVLNLGGEALPHALAQGLYDTGTVERVVNLYGPTEDTTYSTWSVVEPGGERVWIGRPVANTRAWVVDAALRPVPVGVPGELYLAGDGLSRGYHRRPGLTAERFVPDPFGPPGSRMYRVGDRVRWRADGNLDYLGRLDHQVKVRGHRVETGEIESVLAEHPAVREAAVVARGEGAGVRLVAYVVADEGREAPGAGELRTFLKERLPDYMVPAGFVALDRLPLSPNGKVDRLSLPDPELSAPPREERAAPRSVVERAIARVWEEVLALPAVGMDDNFFEIGGHSLLVGRMQERLQAALGVEVRVVDLFLYPTVRALAEHLAAASAADEGGPDETAGESAERGSGRRERMGRLRRR
ncbi:MAG: non-ribosomal peptide synthetase, partial [Longimicrobiaceae bacterium]